MEEIRNLFVKNGKYTLHGRFTFETEKGTLVLTPQDAIEIATTLFDWAGENYEPIINIEDKIERGEI